MAVMNENQPLGHNWGMDPYGPLTAKNVSDLSSGVTYVSTDIPLRDLSFADDAVILVDKDFTLTGKEFKRCLKVLMKIVENDYPEELL